MDPFDTVIDPRPFPSLIEPSAIDDDLLRDLYQIVSDDRNNSGDDVPDEAATAFTNLLNPGATSIPFNLPKADPPLVTTPTGTCTQVSP